MFFIAACFGVRSQTIPEPEYKGNMLLVHGTTGTPLEKQKSSSKSGLSASVFIIGVGKAKSSAVVDGVSSPVRISGKDKVELIVRAQDNSVDPVQIVNFFKLTPNTRKGNRFIMLSQTNSLSSTETMKIQMVPFTSAKYGTSSYLLTVAHLEPGEYALTLEGSRDLFNMFGVD